MQDGIDKAFGCLRRYLRCGKNPCKKDLQEEGACRQSHDKRWINILAYLATCFGTLDHLG